VPDVSSVRPGSALLWAILVAGVSMWISFAIVASATRISPRPAVPARARPEAAPIGLALSAAPALRLRATLREHSAASPTALSAQPAPAAPSAPAPAPASARTPSAAPAAPKKPTTVPQAPSSSPRPTAGPQTRRTPEPRRSPPPDFDESAPAGFDTSG
jgi:hypothetical protein